MPSNYRAKNNTLDFIFNSYNEKISITCIDKTTLNKQ
jgi:hypothetical protein